MIYTSKLQPEQVHRESTIFNNINFDESTWPSEADNIREAVFLYLINHWQEINEQLIYFLDFGLGGEHKDPSNEFIYRFKNNVFTVKRVSSCKIQTSGVKDKKTGKKGIVLQVRSIKWISDNEVKVEAGYYLNGLGIEHSIYDLRKENGKWVVKDKRIQFQS